MIQKAVVAYFEKNNIPVSQCITIPDSDYPCLVWNGAKLSQARGEDLTVYSKVINNVGEFLKIFSNPTPTINLNDTYTAEFDVDDKVVVVGCQKIPFEKVLEVAKLIQENS